jgi:hypothetical protein
MTDIAVQTTITPASIEQGQIVGPTQIVQTGTPGTILAAASAQVVLVYDSAYVTDTAILVQELNAILTFLQTNGSISV